MKNYKDTLYIPLLVLRVEIVHRVKNRINKMLDDTKLIAKKRPKVDKVKTNEQPEIQEETLLEEPIVEFLTEEDQAKELYV